MPPISQTKVVVFLLVIKYLGIVPLVALDGVLSSLRGNISHARYLVMV